MRGMMFFLARRLSALLLLALVSLGASPAATLVPVAALSILDGGASEAGACTYVLLDLGSIGARAGDVIVTIPTENGEVELPRIPVPSGTHSVRLLKDILYNGSSIYSLSREELAELVNKYHGLPPNATIVDETLVFLETDPNATRILVPLPRLASAVKAGDEWYPEALRRGLDRRTVFRAAGLTLYVYHAGKKTAHTYNPKPPLSLNSTYTTVIYEASKNGLPRAELARYTIDPLCLWPASKTNVVTATIAETESAPTALSLDEEPPEGGFMVYTRPWRTANPKEGSYGALRNQEITGTTQWSATDQFIIRYNTTRYEVWTTVTPDRDVWLRIKIYINNSLVIDNYRQLTKGIGISWGILVVVDPELPGNYMDPLTVIEVKVELTSISDPQATLRLDSHATARAWITPLNSYNLVHSTEIQLNGMGEPLFGGDDADDARYLVSNDGAAVFMFIGSNSIFEDGISGGISVSSSSDQKYDRYVSVYINDVLASRCLATNPSIPNGTEGVRRAYCAIYENSAVEEIMEYFKIGYTPIIKVVIEGFDPGIDKLWYVEPSYFHVLTRAETIEGSAEYLWRIDPTFRVDANIARGLTVGGSYMGVVTIKKSNIECTDMQDHLASIIFNLPIESQFDRVVIGADVNPTSRGYMGYYHYYAERVIPATYSVEHVSIVLEFHANTKLSVWGAVGYRHGSSEKAEELIKLINTGGWLIGIIGLIAGGTYLTLASLFLSTPAFYFTGSIIATSCTHPADDVVICQLSWNQGWWDVDEEDISLKMEASPPADFPWGSGDLVLQYNIQVRSKVTYDLGASILHRRYITNQYEGTLLLKPVPS